MVHACSCLHHMCTCLYVYVHLDTHIHTRARAHVCTHARTVCFMQKTTYACKYQTGDLPTFTKSEVPVRYFITDKAIFRQSSNNHPVISNDKRSLRHRNTDSHITHNTVCQLRALLFSRTQKPCYYVCLVYRCATEASGESICCLMNWN